VCDFFLTVLSHKTWSEARTHERTCGFKTQQRRLSAEMNSVCPLVCVFVSLTVIMTYQCISPFTLSA